MEWRELGWIVQSYGAWDGKIFLTHGLYWSFAHELKSFVELKICQVIRILKIDINWFVEERMSRYSLVERAGQSRNLDTTLEAPMAYLFLFNSRPVLFAPQFTGRKEHFLDFL